MSGLDVPPGPDPSGGGYAPPANPGDADSMSGAGPYPPGAGPYPPEAGSYPVPPGGYPPPPYGAPYPYALAATGNGYAITALVLGLVSLILSWFPGVDWVLAAVAIIFGAVGISTASRRGGAGRGMAIAGLVLGVITVVLGIIFWAVIYASFVPCPGC
ncbi:MAG: DUF4190 domain-containing protein [Candidatus Dormibacteria bacterium]